MFSVWRSKRVRPTPCEFEHLLAPNVTEAICTLLGHPRFCPDQHPIPEGACCRRAGEPGHRRRHLHRPARDRVGRRRSPIVSARRPPPASRCSPPSAPCLGIPDSRLVPALPVLCHPVRRDPGSPSRRQRSRVTLNVWRESLPRHFRINPIPTQYQRNVGALCEAPDICPIIFLRNVELKWLENTLS
jgi:hypothetical protein